MKTETRRGGGLLQAVWAGGAVLFLFGARGFADLGIDGFVGGASGTWSAGGPYAMAVATGVDATRMIGGTYSVTGALGYSWDGGVVAPSVMVRTKGESLAIVWSASWVGFRLQESGDLSSGAWIDSPEPISIRGDEYEVLIRPSREARFFRLQR